MADDALSPLPKPKYGLLSFQKRRLFVVNVVKVMVQLQQQKRYR